MRRLWVSKLQTVFVSAWVVLWTRIEQIEGNNGSVLIAKPCLMAKQSRFKIKARLVVVRQMHRANAMNALACLIFLAWIAGARRLRIWLGQRVAY